MFSHVDELSKMFGVVVVLCSVAVQSVVVARYRPTKSYGQQLSSDSGVDHLPSELNKLMKDCSATIEKLKSMSDVITRMTEKRGKLSPEMKLICEVKRYLLNLKKYVTSLDSLKHGEYTDVHKKKRSSDWNNPSETNQDGADDITNPWSSSDTESDFANIFANKGSSEADDSSGIPFDFSKIFDNIKPLIRHISTSNPIAPENAAGRTGNNDQNQTENPFGIFTHSENPYSNVSKLLKDLIQSAQNQSYLNSEISKTSTLFARWMGNYSKIIDDMRERIEDNMGLPLDGTQQSNVETHDVLEEKINKAAQRMETLIKLVTAVQSALDNPDGKGKDRVPILTATSGDGSVYYFSSRKRTYSDAIDACFTEHEAYLVMIETQKENNFITNKLIENGISHNYYIGAQKRGSRYRWEHTNKRVRFFSWRQDKKIIERARYDCIQVKHLSAISYRWKDVPCSKKVNYICEKPI